MLIRTEFGQPGALIGDDNNLSNSQTRKNLTDYSNFTDQLSSQKRGFEDLVMQMA